MKISTKGKYGLRIMTDLAVYGKDGCVSIKDIAARENLSEKYLEQIINLLSKHNLVKSIRGAKGGYLLTQEPEVITVEQILIATEGSLAPSACVENSDCCENYCDCVTSFIWAKMYEAVNDVVQHITLDDLAKRKLVNINKSEQEI
ncbi:MAG: Rrf2 family transcriptional regulator [Clostridia bacterium]